MTRYYYRKGKKRGKRYLKITGFVMVFFGILFFSYFFYPILSYFIFIEPAFAQSDIKSPIPVSEKITSLIQNSTDARNWYPQLQNDLNKKKKVESYFFSIPKLKIENAAVSTIDYDLSKHLVQYFGTSTPGELGTAVIFGHSTLPQLFDPKNYKAIFATLHTLKVGDKLFATIDEVTYKYKIFSITITSPDDTEMFSQFYDNSYITLVTCTPPGTTWKRLIVRAQLEKI